MVRVGLSGHRLAVLLLTVTTVKELHLVSTGCGHAHAIIIPGTSVSRTTVS